MKGLKMVRRYRDKHGQQRVVPHLNFFSTCIYGLLCFRMFSMLLSFFILMMVVLQVGSTHLRESQVYPWQFCLHETWRQIVSYMTILFETAVVFNFELVVKKTIPR